MSSLAMMFTVWMLPALLLAGYGFGFLLDSPDGRIPITNATLPPLARPPLRIGSFNIQIFGQTKYAKKDVMNIIIEILARYDLVQILEIRDSQLTVFESLRQDLNKYLQSIGKNETYEKVVSDRLGRSHIKEQYGFLYKSSRLNATDTYQFLDDQDVFEREPFGVLFSSPSTVVDKFALIATHIKPAMAAEEIDNLTMVYEHVQNHWHLDDIIIAGDFNSGCNYMTKHDWATLSLWNDDRFEWLIDNKMDTTVANSFCVYDRFVVGGTKIPASVVTGSVQAYRFDDEMSINKSMAQQVSDHYPIEMELNGLPIASVQVNIETSISFTVTDTKPVTNINDIRAIYRSTSCAGTHVNVKLLREDTHMDHVTATLTSATVDNIVDDLIKFSKNCPGTLSLELLSNVQSYVNSSLLRDYMPNIYGIQVPSHLPKYPIVITCTLISPYTCKVTVTGRISGK